MYRALYRSNVVIKADQTTGSIIIWTRGWEGEKAGPREKQQISLVCGHRKSIPLAC